jgi:hypothetical protein
MLAQETARLICDHGHSDYRNAKQKAADNLGLARFGALPNNQEIEQAIAERNRIFGADHHPILLAHLREVAADVMHELQQFKPRLVGAVLSGNVSEHTPISLHLFSDPAETVGLQLSTRGTQHDVLSRRLKLQRNSVELFPGYRFYAHDVLIETTVFSEQRAGHAPLSPVNGKPMRRAKLSEVQMLATT